MHFSTCLVLEAEIIRCIDTLYDVELAGFAVGWFAAIPLVHYLRQKQLPLSWLVQCEGINSDKMEVP